MNDNRKRRGRDDLVVHSDERSQSEESILDYWTEEKLNAAKPLPISSPGPADVSHRPEDDPPVEEDQDLGKEE